MDDFVFSANAVPSGDTFEACVQSIAHPQNKACVQGINHKGKHIETVIVPVPIGIGRPPLDKGEYDDTNTFYPNRNFLNSNDNTAYGGKIVQYMIKIIPAVQLLQCICLFHHRSLDQILIGINLSKKVSCDCRV